MKRLFIPALVLLIAGGCRDKTPDGPGRASGYVEATEMRVSTEVAGRIVDLALEEGRRVTAGEVIARLDTSDVELTIRRAQADRDQQVAQLKLLQAGARPEEIRQARAQAESAAADVTAAQAELTAAAADLQRFQALLDANAGSRKQRDDAAARQQVAAARVESARDRARAAAEAHARVRAGARAEEVAAARARVAAAEAQLATLQKNLNDATVKSPVTGTVTSKLVDVGELVARGAPLAVVSDLEHAWANVYVDEPVVPLLKLGQAATLVTDAGQRIPGSISFISPRAEFTPRNVQTADERSKLVYRIKVSVDNRDGILKPGMPVECELGR